ncbi:hypothetical protein M514_22042, partial [Trichuris suis]
MTPFHATVCMRESFMPFMCRYQASAKHSGVIPYVHRRHASGMTPLHAMAHRSHTSPAHPPYGPHGDLCMRNVDDRSALVMIHIVILPNTLCLFGFSFFVMDFMTKGS